MKTRALIVIQALCWLVCMTCLARIFAYRVSNPDMTATRVMVDMFTPWVHLGIACAFTGTTARTIAKRRR